jgi:hypothetical protein
MPIDPSGSASSLIDALRADITRRSERNRRLASGEAGHTPGDAAALKRELADLVRTAPDDDPQARDALQRRVIETVLRWEFGGKRPGETGGNPMLEHVARMIEADPRHGERFARLMRELQR